MSNLVLVKNPQDLDKFKDLPGYFFSINEDKPYFYDNCFSDKLSRWSHYTDENYGYSWINNYKKNYSNINDCLLKTELKESKFYQSLLFLLSNKYEKTQGYFFNILKNICEEKNITTIYLKEKKAYSKIIEDFSNIYSIKLNYYE